MPDASTWALFIAAALALLLVPGPAVLYIVARSMHQGRTAGLVSVGGVQVGTLFHVGAAALGLSAILVTSALAFNVVKYLGAAYLIYLGVRTLLARGRGYSPATVQHKTLSQIFLQGVAVNVLNPKTALFFFAFLPQFVHPAHGPVGWQVLALGATFVLLGLLTDGAYALLSGTLGGWLKTSRRFNRAQRYLTGGIYVGLGLTTALASPSASSK